MSILFEDFEEIAMGEHRRSNFIQVVFLSRGPMTIITLSVHSLKDASQAAAAAGAISGKISRSRHGESISAFICWQEKNCGSALRAGKYVDKIAAIYDTATQSR